MALQYAGKLKAIGDASTAGVIGDWRTKEQIDRVCRVVHRPAGRSIGTKRVVIVHGNAVDHY